MWSKSLRLFVMLGLLASSLSLYPAHAAIHSNSAVSYAWDGTLRRIRVPILMYHYVSPLPQNADVYRTDLTVDPIDFRSHIQYLRDNAYNTISLYDLHDALMTGSTLPPNPVILTFDDGYRDHYEIVFPILQEFDFVGTFFVITGRVDRADPNHLTWHMVTEMAEAGMSMEPHTKSHLDLRERDYNFLVYEVVGSIESIEAHTGRPARMFAYPGGRFDADTLVTLSGMPILRAVTTQTGTLHTTDNHLQLPRLRVSRTTGITGLQHLLSGF